MGGFSDTSGDDNIKGTDADDTFYMYEGGNDVVKGMAGNDTYYFEDDTFTAEDRIDGGTDYDYVRIRGDYSAGLTFSATTMTNVELLEVYGNPTGKADKIVFNDATVAAGANLLVASYALGLFDGSAETDGSYTFLQESGPCTFIGGGGDDIIELTVAWSSKDHYDGGAGHDIVYMGFSGQTLHFSSASLQNIEELHLASQTNLTMSDRNIAAGQTLTVQIYGGLFDGSAEKDGAFDIESEGGSETLIGGHGADTIMGGDGDVRIIGGGGADLLTGGGEADTFAFLSLTDSTKRATDHITDLEIQDVIDLSAIDADASKAGDQAFHLVAKFSGDAGEATYKFKAGETVLSLDVNGDGKADMVIAVDGDHHDFTNFVL